MAGSTDTPPAVLRFVRVEGEPDPSTLAPWELARLERLRVPAAGRAFVAAHLLAREVVAELAGEELEIAQRCAGCGGEDHGAPYVVGRPHLFVSLSHSHNNDGVWVAAIAAASPCGIDVQLVNRVPDRALTARELAGVGLDLVARNRLWARKEALIKSGAATLDDLGSLDVSDPRPGLHDWEAPTPDVVGAWAVR